MPRRGWTPIAAGLTATLHHYTKRLPTGTANPFAILTMTSRAEAEGLCRRGFASMSIVRSVGPVSAHLLSAGERRRLRLLEWVYDAAEGRDVYVAVRSFIADSAEDEAALDADVRHLESRRFIRVVWEGGRDNHLQLLPGGTELVERTRERRRKPRLRRTACQGALLEWLYEKGRPGGIALEGLLDNPRGLFYGETYTDADIAEGAQFLGEHGLIKGAWGAGQHLVRGEVTSEGKRCVEQYDADVAAYLKRQELAAASVTVTGSHNVNVAAASPGGSQSINVSTDARAAMFQVADALDTALPVLGLSPSQKEEARGIVVRLREDAAHGDLSSAETANLLNAAGAIAVGGTSSALGHGIVALAQQAAQMIGLG